jgi:hypothetical protein
MADGSKPEAQTAPALGISVNVQVDGNRQIAFQTFVARDDSPQVLNKLLDQISKAADRQVAKAVLISLRKELYQHEKALRDQAEDTERVNAQKHSEWEASGRKGPYKLDDKEKAALNNIAISAQKYKDGIVDIKAKIAEAEAKVADET